MPITPYRISRLIQQLKNIFLPCILLSACTIVRNYQKDKPFITENSIEVKEGNFTKDEKASLKQRLNSQLDDSSKVSVVSKYFIRRVINNPPVYDSNASIRSARNMKTSMLHLGYYNASVNYKADTIQVGKQQRVHVSYNVIAGKPTLIDTVQYILRKPDLQALAMQDIDEALLIKEQPITKAAVLGELARLVKLFRNNGYYKFTSEELRVRGDTTVAALTTVTEDIFEQLRLLAEAQAARDSPTIKLAVVLNLPTDSNRLKKYFINNIYILPDFQPGDDLKDTITITERKIQRRACKTCPREIAHIIRYHKHLFRSSFLVRNVLMKKGDFYKQDDFSKTLNNFSKSGVWQNINIQIIELKDSINKIDLVIQLTPSKKFNFEAAIETSYSAISNTNNVTAANAGNLLGISGNVSILNRNFRKEGIKMSNSLRTGVEFNFKPDNTSKNNLINSNELSYSNNIVFPRFIFPFKNLNRNKRFISTESFINTNLSYINRINLFDLQSVNLGIGYDWNTRKNQQWIVKPFNVEFARLYNETDSFKKTLEKNPFLRYSFNTALVAGSSVGYRFNKINTAHPNKQHSIKVNLEESGLSWGRLGILKKYIRQFVKADAEYVYSANYSKSAFVFRLFGGIGIASKKDTTLPFFKQYFGGGSNSMRAWPIRGIGRGAQPLAPYDDQNKFNDRTGDIQLESNLEYRYNILQIIPNSLVLKGALFVDIGNVWNFRNSKPDGSNDEAQFKLKNLYKELGIAAGTGFRLDFNFFIVRFDLGFRFKRPELSNINDGWKAPSLGFDDILQKLFSKNQRQWRYENFNFTIGINYPF